MQTPVMPKGTDFPPDLSRIAQDLQIRRSQVESVVQLLDEANTVPFITRYRKERTGGLDEEAIRQIQARVQLLRQLGERKQTILKSIEAQGKLTDELRTAILSAETSKRLEDLYLPYKPKKRTLATIARERGLEPFAEAIWNRDPAVANLSEVLPGMVNPDKELPTTDDVLAGVQHILAEKIAETAEVRAPVRFVLWKTGKLRTTKAENVPEGRGLEYKDYFQFSETVRQIPPHRILAINRGEKENSLKASLDWDAEAIRNAGVENLSLADHPHAEFLRKVVDDALTRLLLPSLEREIRRELTEEAEDHAVRVFARNLRSLLLQPPLRNRRILAIDPAIRTGCKLAALDETGNLLEHAVVHLYSKPEKGKRKNSDKPDAGTKESAGTQFSGATQARGTIETKTTDCVPSTIPLGSFDVAPGMPALEMAAVLDVPPTAQSAGLVEISTAAISTLQVLPTVSEHISLPGVNTAEISPASSSFSTAPCSGTSSTTQAAAALRTAPPTDVRAQAKDKLEEMVRKHNLNVIGIGNGTGCRETEELVSELIAERLPTLEYVIINEAGASVYSASAVGREEFPKFDATLRGTISIGRRLQDPLSELVKIDPQNIGVGLYQHDIHPRRLKDSLEAVVESCVNQVGVDANTASVSLLRHVSGLNQLVARELVDYRKQHGPFKNREQLLQVPSIGPNRFVQAAGFLKIIDGDNPLDETWVHPESYAAVQRLLAEIGADLQTLKPAQKSGELKAKLETLSPETLNAKLEIGAPTLFDIMDAMARPGRDPREDLPAPIFKKGILKLEDLQAGAELKGTVLNVVDFGAFVDIGLKDSGLVHISQLANRYIRNPYEIVSVGDVVSVWVLAVDQQRRRVSLTMIKPGTGRKPTEKRPQQDRGQSADRPPSKRRRTFATKAARPGVPAKETVTAAPAAKEASHAPATPVEQPPRPAARTSPPAPQRQVSRHRKGRQTAKPKLSQAALEGTAPLRSFGELGAFFEAQRRGQPPRPHQAEPEPKAEESTEVSSS
jgi:uncharacterized protein